MLTWLIATDAAENVRRMVDDGWAAGDAVAATRRWFLDVVVTGLDAGLLFGAVAA